MEDEPRTASVEESAGLVARGIDGGSEVNRRGPMICDGPARRHPQILAAESACAIRSQEQFETIGANHREAVIIFAAELRHDQR